jgi:hypothetical protein
MKVHLGQSNVRFSEVLEIWILRASSMRVRHLEHSGRSIGLGEYSNEDMTPSLLRREHNTLCHR